MASFNTVLLLSARGHVEVVRKASNSSGAFGWSYQRRARTVLASQPFIYLVVTTFGFFFPALRTSVYYRQALAKSGVDLFQPGDGSHRQQPACPGSGRLASGAGNHDRAYCWLPEQGTLRSSQESLWWKSGDGIVPRRDGGFRTELPCDEGVGVER